MLPKDGMVTGTEMYTGENLLSYTFLGHGLTADYEQEGERNLRVFISFADTDDAAKKQTADTSG